MTRGTGQPAARGAWVLAAGALAAVGAILLSCRPPPEPRAAGSDAGTAAEHAPSRPAAETAAAAASCIECHAEAHADWARSHHAHAQRMVSTAEDAHAFDPAQTLIFESITTEVFRAGTNLQVTTVGPDGDRATYTPDMVIGKTPLIQYLIPFPGGRWQTLSVSYDPHTNEWFEVYGDQDRRPDEWGFWANRGMNWNVQCAYCHMTNLKKGYDPASDTYRTTWDEIAISCAQCHGDMPGHAEAAARDDYVSPEPLAPAQTMEMCATCHSRREEFNEDFEPGDRFADHYRLSLPSQPGLYYADGQIRDEVYVYGSLMMSRMGHAGVTCLDCHDPHSGETKVPPTDNALCLQCHIPPGLQGAIPINPATHSHHAPDSTGNRCVECHMAETTYMDRDPRRDHGFIIPDPQMTVEFGIPNSCNRCHDDQSAEWAAEWTQTWYGDRMDRPTRTRTRAVARAQQGDDAVADELLALARDEEIPAWRGALISLLGQWLERPDIRGFVRESAGHEHPWVRSAALNTLRPAPEATEVARERLHDPVRQVRLDAALLLAGQLTPGSPEHEELTAFLDHTSDQPAGAVRQVELALAEQRTDDALRWAKRATEWDPSSGYVHYLYGAVLNRTGQNPEATAQMERAVEIEPDNPDLHFGLSLLYAEQGRTRDAVRALTSTVNLAPEFARAWYNLGLGHAALEHLDLAVSSLRKAESLDPNQPDFPYARATIHLRQQNPDAARDAALRALSIQPTHPGARALLQSLGP